MCPSQYAGSGGYSLAERVSRDSRAQYRKKGIIGKKHQNLSVIKAQPKHFVRDTVYIERGRNYLSEELEEELYLWAM